MASTPENNKTTLISKFFFLKRIWFWLALILIFGGGAWWLWGSEDGSYNENTPTAIVTRGPLIVSVIEEGEVDTERKKVISNRTRRKATIKTVVDEGTFVKKGDVIIEFESQELLDAVDQAKLNLTTAQNNYIQAQASLELTQKKVAQEIKKAKQAVTNAKEDLKRFIEGEAPLALKEQIAEIALAKRDLLLAKQELDFKLKINADPELEKPYSENEIEADRLSVQRLHQKHDKANATLDMLKTYDHPKQLRELKTKVSDAELDLERAQLEAKIELTQSESEKSSKKANLMRREDRLKELLEEQSNLKIIANSAGLVVYDTGWRNSTVVAVGEVINPRQQLMKIPDMDTLQINTRLFESVINQVKPSQRALIRLDSRPNEVLTGKVGKKGVMPVQQHWSNPGIRVVPVSVKFDNPGMLGDLKPGMKGKVEIEIKRLKDALQVPVAAVFSKGDQTFCRTLNDQGEIETVRVEVGLMSDDCVEIKSGLKEDDRVMLTPPEEIEEDVDSFQKVDSETPKADSTPSPASQPTVPRGASNGRNRSNGERKRRPRKPRDS